MAVASAPRMSRRFPLTLARAARHREVRCARALREVASLVRAGSSLGTAFDKVGSDAANDVELAFRDAANQLRLNVDLSMVLARLATRLGDPSIELFARVLTVQHRHGGDPGALCQRIAALLDDRVRLRNEQHAATAQARFAARVVIVLPLLIAVLWAYVAPASLLTMVSGKAVFALVPSAVLLLLGVLVIRRISRAVAQGRVQRTPSGGSRNARKAARSARWWDVVERIAGRQPRAMQRIRLGAAATPAGVVWCLATGTGMGILSAILGVSAMAVVLDAREWQERRALREDAAREFPLLLELTIAYASAGSPAAVAARHAANGCPGRLGRQLQHALEQVRLGRSLASALATAPVVQLFRPLDRWTAILVLAERLGSPVVAPCEAVLADARAHERERLRARAASVGPRIQLATVLLIVPAILWVILVAIGHGLMHELTLA